MTLADLDRVAEIAQELRDAPHWPRAAYAAALNPGAGLPRIALVAVEVAGEGKTAGGIHEEHTSGAKAHVDSAGLTRGLKPSPPSGSSFSAACKAHVDSVSLQWGLKPSPPSQSSLSDDIGVVGGGMVVGFLVASMIPPQAELESIAVDPAFQRRGVARELFAALVEEIRSAQGTEVILEARASNFPALALYSALGFAEIGRRPRYYADPIEDAVLMRLRLA
jgi:ribosomal-protein-alanine N-acetyltransferase